MTGEVRVILAEDNPNDAYIIKEVFEEIDIRNDLVWVKDGQELLEYLYHLGNYANETDDGRDQLIILDLNMPKMNGFEALEVIRNSQDQRIKSTPVIVLTTSPLEQDLAKCHAMGIYSYVVKPQDYNDVIALFEDIKGLLDERKLMH